MKRHLTFPALVLLFFLVSISCQNKIPRDNLTSISSNEVNSNTNFNEIRFLAAQIYAFGYPLVLMDITKDMMTHTSMATEAMAPMNQFVHKRSFPDASFIQVINPNVDALYSSAWLDLSKEPIILSLPETGNRFVLMQMMSAWTEVFANPGSRTTGGHQQNFVITGPSWQGNLPMGVRQINAPTNDVWIVGRTEVDSPKNLQEALDLQKQYKLTPLSSWGFNYNPPSSLAVKEGVNMRQAPVDQLESLTGLEFFIKMAEAMRRNPPSPQETLMVEKMKRIGISPGQIFDPMTLSLQSRSAIEEGARNALHRIINAAKNPTAEKIDGWVYNFDLGRYGANYENRATISRVALGASLPQDVLYIRTLFDSQGKRLNGTKSYFIHFAKSQVPPVDGFWSLTMYNRKNYFVKNPLNRYALGSHDKISYNRDGSFDIYLQYQPTDKQKLSNWLPTPQGDFNLVMRLYAPQKEVLARHWHAPPVQKIDNLKKLSQQISKDDTEH